MKVSNKSAMSLTLPKLNDRATKKLMNNQNEIKLLSSLFSRMIIQCCKLYFFVHNMVWACVQYIDKISSMRLKQIPFLHAICDLVSPDIERKII